VSRILIQVGRINLRAELYETPTAKQIRNHLPLEGTVHRWGDEIYFDIGLRIESEPEARADVEVGDVGYWPTGSAFCMFFGPTPVSTDARPRAYSPVNVFGRLLDDLQALGQVTDGEPIRVDDLTESP